jgi:DNA repair exonuclease SbcCD nuclease subunit
MRFLCASDLHLGRRVSGIPAHLSLDPARLATASVWDHLVDIAVAREVDAVLLAGNLIDRENRGFEPLGPIERGLTTLAHHGIPVYAVAGDEDFDVLRGLADEDATGTFHLVGRDGQWSRDAITGKGGEAVTLLGWGAAGQRAPGTPLVNMPAPTDEADGPTVALVHGSLVADDARGAFAPVSADDLDEHHVDLWILGHGTRPEVEHIGEATVLQPGATCPLGPADVGARGAWIIEIAPGWTPECQPLAIAPVRFERIDVDVTGMDNPEQIENEVVRALHQALASAVADDPGGALVVVPCALRLTGTTSRHADVPALLRELARTLDIQHRGVIAAVAGVTVDTRPPIDLALLTGRPDPVGELARLLTALDGDAGLSPSQEALLQRTATRLQGAHRARVFAAIASDPEPGLDDARAALRREGWTVLDALVRQRGVE